MKKILKKVSVFFMLAMLLIAGANILAKPWECKKVGGMQQDECMYSPSGAMYCTHTASSCIAWDDPHCNPE